jgi:hypothetical protein
LHCNIKPSPFVCNAAKRIKKEVTMFNRLVRCAAAGVLLTFTAVTAHADKLPENLGPVGPNEPILTDVGAKRVLAWYKPDRGGCAVTAVVWNRSDVDGTSTAGMRIRLEPGEIAHFDSSYNIKSLNLQCAADAKTLRIVD